MRRHKRQRQRQRQQHDLPRVELPINYEWSIEEMFTTLALNLINRERPFGGPGKVLHNAGSFRRISLAIHSWVPDWRAPKRCMAAREVSSLHRLKGFYDPFWRISQHRKIMHLTGWKYGKISKKGEGFSTMDGMEKMRTILHNSSELVEDLCYKSGTAMHTVCSRLKSGS